MFLPIGDSPNLPKTPWMTWGLIAINVAIHVALWPMSLQPADMRDPDVHDYLQVLAAEVGAVPAQLSVADLVAFRHGFRPAVPTLGDAFSSMFLHGGLAHLFGNMLFLFIFGDNVEHRLGRWRFLLVYLATGFVATGGDALLRWGSGIPTVGASGAISGVLGLYFGWFPHNRVRVWVFLFPIYIGVTELTARLVLGLYLVVQNLLPALLTVGGGVSHGAHIGGFLAGWAITGVAGRWLSRGAIPHFFGPRAAREPETLATEVGGLLRTGRIEEAANLWLQAPNRYSHELAPTEALSLAGALEEAHFLDLAIAVYRRLLSTSSSGPIRANAHLGAARVLVRGLGSPTVAYQHLSAAMHEDPSPAATEEAHELAAVLRRRTSSLPRQLFR